MDGPMDMEPFWIRESLEGGRLVMALGGEIDLEVAPRLRAALEAHAEEDLVLDLSRVTFVDSTGFSALVNVLRQRRAAERELPLRAPSRPVRRLLELSGLDQVFVFEPGSETESRADVDHDIDDQPV
ncbi:MAG: STAS domain-containing protein [Acidimicrobiales bacterium]